MDAYKVKMFSDIAITIASLVLPTLAAWLLKKISNKDRRELVRQTAVHAFKFVAELPQVKDNPQLDAMGAVLARVAQELNGLTADEEKYVKSIIESAHVNPSIPQRLPNFSPSIQLPQAKIK